MEHRARGEVEQTGGAPGWAAFHPRAAPGGVQPKPGPHWKLRLPQGGPIKSPSGSHGRRALSRR
ncbi:Os04g0426266 protein (fragment) [Mesorhizobium plurifarium]|uniref:Os04g0426266 protein n=1 Tax=Mesorhizobium plurifarium TaxID=69974 RepID=A0A090F6W2_MESPL